MNATDNAFAQGAKAYADGVKITKVPYQPLSLLGKAWIHGWMDAEFRDYKCRPSE